MVFFGVLIFILRVLLVLNKKLLKFVYDGENWIYMGIYEKGY